MGKLIEMKKVLGRIEYIDPLLSEEEDNVVHTQDFSNLKEMIELVRDCGKHEQTKDVRDKVEIGAIYFLGENKEQGVISEFICLPELTNASVIA